MCRLCNMGGDESKHRAPKYMSVVTLVSGGLDSTLMALLTKEQGLDQHPLFVHYNQLNFEKEFAACKNGLKRLGIQGPEVVDVSGYGSTIPSGLTSKEMHISEQAFLPGRNLMFLLLGSAYAHEMSADAVAIGLLDESSSLFPDQTSSFVRQAEDLMSTTMGRSIKLLVPLIDFRKADVVVLAKEKGIYGTYSCHAGGDVPCGECISCKELGGIEEN